MKHICITILILLLSQTIAAQQLHTTLDVLRPAQRQLPADINDLLIVNNIAVQPKEFGHANKRDDASAGMSEIDLGKAPLYLLFATTQTLEESDMLQSVSLLEHSQNKGSFYMKHSLGRTEVDSLCQIYGTDAVLSCDQLVIYDVEESYFTDAYTYLAYLEAYQTTVWTLHYPDGRHQSYAYSDTLYWEHEDYTREAAVAGLPDRQTALLDMSAYIGERFAGSFVPYWETVDRYFYENDNRYIQQGWSAFVRKQWDMALQHWQEAYAEKDRLTQAYAAANIAGTYEIKGDMDTAISWVDNAIAAFSHLHSADAQQQKVNLSYYKQQLQQRQRDEAAWQQ